MTTARLGARHCCSCSRVCHHVGPARFCAEHKPQARVAVPAYVNAPPTVSGINGRDMSPVALAFIVRDLMAAAGYEYDPERPLADQSRECCDLIRLTASEWHLTIAARANDSERHEAEVERFTSLLDEMRRQLRYALKVVDDPTIVAWRRKPRLAMPLPHEWDELVRERDRLKEQLGQDVGHPCNGGYRCAAPGHVEGCLSGDVTTPKSDADGG